MMTVLTFSHLVVGFVLEDILSIVLIIYMASKKDGV